ATGDDVPCAEARGRVNRRVGRAWIDAVTAGGERHDAAARGRDTDRRIGEVVRRRAERALPGHAPGGWIDDVPADAGTVFRSHGDGSVERAPELAVRIDDLLHPGVIRVGSRHDLRRTGAADEEGPAADEPVEQNRRPVVEAVALWRVRARRRARAGLLLLGGKRVLVDRDEPVG